jgi:hypothetical protein
MHQSRTLYLGLDVHPEAIAVASGANAHAARSLPWTPSAPSKPTSTSACARGTSQPNTWSLSMKRDHAGPGSIALGRKKAMSATSTRPPA